VTDAKTLAIVPVKALDGAKRRLASALAPCERRRLVLAMLNDVLALLRAVPSIGRVLVVTPDPEVASLATSHGADIVAEDGHGDLNAAVRRGLAHAGHAGAARALVIPADVPLATRAEIVSILACAPVGPKPQVVIVPSEDGEGTNALLLAPPEAMRPEFGEGSFVRHVAQAVAVGLDFAVLRLPGLAADIDQPPDLARLAACDRYAFLNATAKTGPNATAKTDLSATAGTSLEATDTGPNTADHTGRSPDRDR
jgi:2-phospho-L-lactate guanylyltransferase